ncbi:MAG: hypothetical protein ABW127_09845 [Candidatus Thiodiazotropha endolucinida]
MVSTFLYKKDLLVTVEMIVVYSMSILNEELGDSITHIIFPEASRHMEMTLEQRRSDPNAYVYECVTKFFSHHVDYKHITECDHNINESYCEINGTMVKSTEPFFFLSGDNVVIHVLYQYLNTILTLQCDEDSIKYDMYEKVLSLKNNISRLGK